MTSNDSRPALDDCTTAPHIHTAGTDDFPAPHSTSAAAGVSPGSGVLTITRGANAGTRFLLIDDITTAGRHPDSEVFLDDVTVSRRHAEIRWLENKYWAIDAGSLNGIYVNRTQVQSLPLTNGDEIQIGKFRLEFSCQPRPEHHP